MPTRSPPPPRSGARGGKTQSPRRGPRRNADRTRARILRGAIAEFAANGYSGANPRMLYHHFGDKDGLYLCVLEEVIGDLRREELKLAVDHVEPIAGMMQLFDFIHRHFGASAAQRGLTGDDLAAHRSTWDQPLSLSLSPAPRRWRRRRALADRGVKLAFAACRRHVADPGDGDRSDHAAAAGLSRRRGAPDQQHRRSPARAAARARARHGLSRHRRRRGADGVVHPVQLPGLRVGRRGPRHGDRAAKLRAGLLAGAASPQLCRWRQASVPHHPAGLRHQRQPGGVRVRGHGRAHAAARACR
jgi:AcrR family transcriptional regulator